MSIAATMLGAAGACAGEGLFIEPDKINSMQLLFLTAIYGVILYQSSNLIATGSEYLQLFPSVAGIVGSIVLPILGAVPDGVMVLFSGLGPDAQDQVSVGVGALAGSTVMLLTFPWFIAVRSGRVPMTPEGTAKYGPSSGDEPLGTLQGCVTYQDPLAKNALIMIGTTLLFFVIQVPATMQESDEPSTKKQAANENLAAGVGIGFCILAFCGYLIYCYRDANEDKQLARLIEGIKKKKISIGAALRWVKATATATQGNPQQEAELGTQLLPQDLARFKKIVKPFFVIFDTDQNGTLDLSEFKCLLRELGEKPTQKAQDMFKEKDADGDDKLSFDEITQFLYGYLDDDQLYQTPEGYAAAAYMPKYNPDDADEEEEEMPEDLADLTPDQQFKRLLFRAVWMMGMGTFLVLIFSDPMVDALGDWGRRLDVSPFYISFVLAPFASNASELLAAYTYAAKKSTKTITCALSSLIGAACMNNTFCLAIFLALVYFKELAWKFTAETIAIVVIQWFIGGLTYSTRTHSMKTALMILLCYPGCLALVWFLENIIGLD